MTKTHEEALRAAINDFERGKSVGTEKRMEAAIQTYLSKRGQEAWNIGNGMWLSKNLCRAISHPEGGGTPKPVLIIPQPDRKEVVPDASGDSGQHVAQPPQEEAGEADNAGASTTPSAGEDIVGRLEHLQFYDVDVEDVAAAARNEIERKEARIKELEEALEAIASYPKEDDPRRTEDGYPGEVVYDEWAYRRMVDSYRDAARSTLSNTQG